MTSKHQKNDLNIKNLFYERKYMKNYSYAIEGCAQKVGVNEALMSRNQKCQICEISTEEL